MPGTTQEVEHLREEADFFTNQCYKETRRMIMNDYDLGRENFINMGEMMMKFTHELTGAWMDLMQRYHSLNEDRKK